MKIYGATLLPYEEATFAVTWSSDGEAARTRFNEWLRASRAYDGVIDFDAIVRDPSRPSRLLPRFDSGDHLHPNDAGYQAMADAIALKLFDTVN